MLACAASAQASSAGPPPTGLAALQLAPAGSGVLTWFGIRAYEARLWVADGFRHQRFGQHAFALELHYLRDFSAADIASRSLREMRRAGPIADVDARAWQQQLQQALPDVRAGDRITGVNRPGEGLAFVVNGRPGAVLADPVLAERFFGIWLAPTTSEPALRAALLAAAPP